MSDLNTVTTSNLSAACPKSVLITGASSGIGRELALQYANDGYQVIACGQNNQKLVALMAEHPAIEALVFDVTDLEQTHKAFHSLPTIPSLIILNAGTCEYINHGEMDAQLVKRVFTVNVFGIANCIEALQARFDSHTHLVVMGSSASYLPLPRAEAYGASKAAIAYLTYSYALDVKEKGIFVSLVSPGFVKTPLTDKNDFAMPMLMSVSDAAQSIRAGITAKKTEIHFPAKFTYWLKLMALLPVNIQQWMVRKMTRRSS
ncbi:SDR family NAD(P)-dependent oxidoreductase [Photobacterium damselae subsp. damselae]|uniref:SDR family NAD(P)-dependent oxidoreductase n=1 Tax=Photobacterium damselae TaxID=38293 RepID=UPI000A2FEE4C|nr:SDR family NAD(P)-dependent oxidoreductase [Photobacterium damselae]ARR51036.1 short-chain dehydrogenase [Photobacterium damselae subsp. damselae]QAY37175.1 SDR family NAD(P)-dependent oxidoreductase [Photobacterium damselae subsp. damselae]QOQ70249.1 SDR family NAD(P)-dependent oxidoreductase [Photobacterium damselae subsp. damselae]